MTRSTNAGSRLYGLLLLLLPPRFRARYGTELLECVAAQALNAPHGVSARRRRQYWRRELLDLCRTIMREWAALAANHRTTHSSPIETVIEMFRNVLADILYSARALAQRPTHSIVIVVTLALGVGATSAVFSVVDGVLLQPLDYTEPDRLVIGYGSFPANDSASVSPPDYVDYRDQVGAFEALAAATSYRPALDLTGSGEPERLRARRVSANLFTTLGVAPLIGRSFTTAEATDGGPDVAILSYGLWTRRFAADSDIIGTTIQLDGVATTVVGVMPPAFTVLGADNDLWLPIAFGGESTSVRRFHFLRVIGRLPSGADLASVQQEVDAVAARLAQEYPDSNTDWTMRLVPLHEARFGATSTPLLVLMGASLAVLLIGCSNIALLLLARSTTRTAEIAIRSALGASSPQIVRLVLSEGMVLAGAGGALGLLLAHQVIGALTWLAGSGLPRIESVALDARAVAVGLVLTGATGAVFGLVPALRTIRRDLTGDLKGAARTSPSRSAQRFRSGLVVVQLTMSVALLIGAGLFIRSLGALRGVDIGFRGEGVLTATVSLPESRYPDSGARARFWRRLDETLAARVGVEGVGMIDTLPFTGSEDTWLFREGQPPAEGSQGTNAQLRAATDGYFDAMRVPLVAGRLFDAREQPDAPLALVIDEPLATAMFADEGAVGQAVVVDLGSPQRAVVIGVVGGVHHFGPGAGAFSTMYFSARQRPMGGATLAVRGDGAVAELAPTVRAVLGEIDPQLPVSGVAPMLELVDNALDGPRFRTVLLGTFAVIALLLAALGVYGALSYFVAERRREMGLRMALGAEASQVVRLVLRRGMALVVSGLALGTLASLALGRLVANLLFGVSAYDPVAIAGVAALLTLVGWTACWLPSRRTTRIDPVEVMRAE